MIEQKCRNCIKVQISIQCLCNIVKLVYRSMHIHIAYFTAVVKNIIYIQISFNNICLLIAMQLEYYRMTGR